MLIACPGCSTPLEITDDANPVCSHCRQSVRLPTAETIEAEPVEAHDVAERVKFQPADWEIVRSGLNLIARSAIILSIAQAINFLAQAASMFLDPHSRLLRDVLSLIPDLRVVMLLAMGAINFCGVLVGLVGAWMAQAAPRSSGLGWCGTVATFAFAMVPVGLIGILPAMAAEAGPLPVLALLVFASLAFIVGAILYLIFLSNMAKHFDDKPLAGQFTRLLVMLTFCCIAGVVALMIAVLIVVTYPHTIHYYDPWKIRVIGIVQGVILAGFLLGAVFQVHFSNLVRRLQYHVETVMQ